MSIIEKLYKKYENDEYITQLINHKIENLPKIIDEAYFLNIQKKKKIELLKNEQNLTS